jgi:mannosylglycoprotein endo-beta-mannosidase
VFWASLLTIIENLDRVADAGGLDEEGWALRYHLEDHILLFDKMEEEYWKQQSRVQWLTKGDACTAYFHAIANGRRRKCWIPRPSTPQGEVANQSRSMNTSTPFIGS